MLNCLCQPSQTGQTRAAAGTCSGASLSSVAVGGARRSKSPPREIWGRLGVPHLPKHEGEVLAADRAKLQSGEIGAGQLSHSAPAAGAGEHAGGEAGSTGACTHTETSEAINCQQQWTVSSALTALSLSRWHLAALLGAPRPQAGLCKLQIKRSVGNK